MNNLNLHILTPNKYKNRFFGVDYFLNFLNGNNPSYRYYSTSIDQNPVFKSDIITFFPEMYDFLETELSTKDPAIIGIQNNPDIYSGIDSIEKILNILKKYKMGLYLETTSLKLINDLPLLESFSKEFPLLISIPTTVLSSDSALLDNNIDVETAIKLVQKIKSSNINSGLLIKPVIPYINDNINDFIQLLKKAVLSSADFIYPSFSIKFDSKKIKAFYDIIDIGYPELMNIFKDKYGMKFVWESPNILDLKKNFVILCKKNKILYAMKDIINLYKPDLNIQLKLF